MRFCPDFREFLKDRFLKDLRQLPETLRGEELRAALKNFRLRLDDPNVISLEVSTIKTIIAHGLQNSGSRSNVSPFHNQVCSPCTRVLLHLPHARVWTGLLHRNLVFQVVHALLNAMNDAQDYDSSVKLVEDLQEVSTLSFMHCAAIQYLYAFALNRWVQIPPLRSQ